jgi:hypothetical protein
MISFTPTPICLSPQQGLSLCPSFFSSGVTDFTHGIEPIEFNRHSPFVLLKLEIKHYIYIRMDSKYLIRPFLLMIEIMINWSSIPVSGVP